MIKYRMEKIDWFSGIKHKIVKNDFVTICSRKQKDFKVKKIYIYIF